MLSISKPEISGGNKGKTEYNTPLYLYEYFNRFFHFELDPCSSPGYNHLGCAYTYDKITNGLIQEWDKPAFVNPPYGDGNERLWLNKCIDEFNKHGKPIFIILPSKTELRWFMEGMISAQIIVFPSPRVRFEKDGIVKDNNIIGSVIFGFCSVQSEEYQAFKKFNEDLGSDVVEVIDNGFHSMYFPRLKAIKDLYELQSMYEVKPIS